MKTVEVIVVAHIQNQTWVSKPKWYLSPLFWGRTMSRWTLPTRKAQTYNGMGDGSSVSFHAAVIKDVVGRCQPQTTSGSEQECPRPLIPASCPLVENSLGPHAKKVTRSNCCLIQKAGLFSHDKRDFTQGETYTESQIITIMSLDKLGSGHMKADKK